MKTVIYYVADDGTKFDDEYECAQYERKKLLEEHKDEFQFFSYRKNLIPIEEAITEDVMYIVIKAEGCAEAIGEWFKRDECDDPFYGVYDKCVGTWVYGDVLDRGDEWFKLELEIAEMQSLIDEINK